MSNSNSGKQPLDSKAAYQEAGHNYRAFLDWREKIVGGYVVILGALGIGFHQSEGHCGFQVVLVLAAILVSIAFWILNVRNSEFIFACQRAARELEPEPNGVYNSLHRLTPRKLTHGQAVNILVFPVIAACVFKIFIEYHCWFRCEYFVPFLMSTLVLALLITMGYIKQRRDQRRNTAKPQTAGSASSGPVTQPGAPR